MMLPIDFVAPPPEFSFLAEVLMLQVQDHNESILSI